MEKNRAIWVDIDGTVADCYHRLHYLPNYKKFLDECDKDLPIENIIWLVKILKEFSNSKIIFCSGRSEDYRQKTAEWLDKQGISYDELFMRKEKDYRSDQVIKKEFLDEIRKTHDVMFALDDRTRVVEMLRKEGLTVLQCNQWEEKPKYKYGHLTLMVGPSGAGKSTFIKERGMEYITVSSDELRQQLCVDFRCQDKNEQVFAALHAVVKARLESGLNTVVDATNIKRKDRLALVDLLPNLSVTYIVLNRPLNEKRRTGGWRNEIPNFDLIGRHDDIFRSNLKDILRGDDRPNVTVKDYWQTES